MGERLRLRPHDGIDGRRCKQPRQLFFPLQDVAGRRHGMVWFFIALSPRWLRLPLTMTTGAPRLPLSEKSDVIIGECGYRSRQIRGHATSGSFWPRVPAADTASRRY
jgi:hypothetical protein